MFVSRSMTRNVITVDQEAGILDAQASVRLAVRKGLRSGEGVDVPDHGGIQSPILLLQAGIFPLSPRR